MDTTTPYPRHVSRIVHVLNGIWDFAFLGQDCTTNSIDPGSIAYTDRMAVPGAFDAAPAYAGKRGTVAYRTTVKTTPGARARIHFHGLGMWCRIFVDGAAVHESSLPYTGFWVNVPASHKTLRELIVIIDNRFDKARVPLQEQFFDFYAYGGIFRSVEWHEVPACCIERVRIKTLDFAVGKIEAEIVLNGAAQKQIDLYTSIDNGPEQAHKNIPVSNNRAVLALTVPHPAPWSLEKPSLHTLCVQTGDDDTVERFGLRKIETKNGSILLNGKPVKLLGYCRHEAHPQYGPALPLQQLVDDLQILKDLGCNFIRGSHYPQDQRFLDLCDEKGFLVMEESLGWGQKVEHFNNPLFAEAQERQTCLMVQNSINHPSIILWGFLNEGASNIPESRNLYARLAACIRAEDPSRLVTYASMFPFDDINFDLADVVCINTYPGWYAIDRETMAPVDEIVPHIKKIMDSLGKRGFGEKPFVLSEIGAGALYGWRDPLHAHWSEEFQAEHLKTVCREVKNNPAISGVSLWQFCDCRTYASAFALTRPRAFNNKGTVDEYRRPKLAYNAVKQIFLGA